MVFDGRTELVEARFEKRIIEKHALRVAHRQRDGLHLLSRGFELDWADVLRHAHGGAKRQRAPLLPLQLE